MKRRTHLNFTHRRWRWLTLLASFFLASLWVSMAAPANDSFASATVLTGQTNFVTTASNIAATKEAGEPDHAGNPGGKSVWWRWTAPISAIVYARTYGSTFDTLLAVYTGTSVEALLEEASNDDLYPLGGVLTSTVRFAATAGTVYHIAVDGSNGAAGPITLDLRQQTPPANDLFANAIDLAGQTNTVTGTNIAATQEAGEPNHVGIPGGRSVWWRWTAPDSGPVVIQTAGSRIDTLLAVYTGATLDTLTQKAANDDVTTGVIRSSVVVFHAVAGTVYHIAVDGFEGASGPITLDLRQREPAPNDLFSEGILLEGRTNRVAGHNIGAGKEAGEPGHAGMNGGRSVWWRWTAPATGPVVVSTAGSSFDTLLAVYTGNSVSALVLRASNNDEDAEQQLGTSVVGFMAHSGTTYHIGVDGAVGAFGTIALEVLQIEPPPNDLFANAVALQGQTTAATGNNGGAARETGELSHGSNGAGRSVWWRWTAPITGPVAIRTTGSSFDTLLAVYTGDRITSLLLRASNNDENAAARTRTSLVNFMALAGTEYSIAVDGHDDAFGSITLDVRQVEPVLNDVFANAFLLEGPTNTVTGSNVVATKDLGEPNHAGNPGGKSVWWRWTAPAHGTVIVRTSGSTFDTLLAVYTGGQVDDLFQLAANNDIPLGMPGRSKVQFGAVAGRVYQIAVDGHNGASGAITLDIRQPVPSDPPALTLLGTAATLGRAVDLRIRGTHVFIATSTAGLEIMNISNPASPVRVGGYDTTGTASAVEVLGDHAYVADGTSGLQIIDIRNPANPVRIGGVDTPGTAFDVHIAGNYAYIADGSAGLQVIDVSNPGRPVRVGGADTIGYARGVRIGANHAYVADGNAGLRLFDVSDPFHPAQDGSLDTIGNALRIHAEAGYVFVADYSGGLLVVESLLPGGPVRTGSYGDGAFAESVDVAGNFAYLANGAAGLTLFDVSNPYSFRRVGGYDTAGYACASRVSRNLVCVADGNSGLAVLRNDSPGPLAFVDSGTIMIDGSFQLRWSGGSGIAALETSVDLISWNELTRQAGSNEPFTFTHTAGATSTTRFYRLVKRP